MEPIAVGIIAFWTIAGFTVTLLFGAAATSDNSVRHRSIDASTSLFPSSA